MSKNISNSIDKTARILVVGEAEDETRNLADALAGTYHISAARHVADAARRLRKEIFSVIIFDLTDDGSDLVNILQTLGQLSPHSPVIVIGHPHDARLIVSAVKAGAFDFVTKPYPPEKIKLSVHQALENRSLKNEIGYLRRDRKSVV